MSPHDSTGQPILSEFAGDADMADLVETFVTELPNRLKAIQDSMAQQDLDTLARLAHQLKGSAGGYGFPQITQQAAALEKQARGHDELTGVAHEVRALAKLCARARAKSA